MSQSNFVVKREENIVLAILCGMSQVLSWLYLWDSYVDDAIYMVTMTATACIII